ncbi:MAG TPA: autotransporter domain-containing protein [Rhizobiaceae bacterium]|nr:autotransporter domain-containing protein [Rhizobiaceae bacterium]
MNNAAVLAGGTGGQGGAGGAAGGGGGGGEGGYGAVIDAFSIAHINAGTIVGGTGGAGGGDGGLGLGGGGGDGGVGVFFETGGTLENTATISGGDGGAGGISFFGDGPSGDGGSGIVGQNITIINSGTISGGLDGAGAVRGFSLNFIGGSNVLRLESGWGLNGGINVGGAGLLTFDQATNVLVANVISGNGGIAKDGAGALELTGTNTYAGGTSVLGGELQVSDDANLGDAAGGIVLDGGTLTVLGAAFTNTNRAVTVGNGDGTLFIDDSFNTFTLDSVVTGNGALIKDGNGELILTGNNTYLGGTEISGGLVSVSADSNLGDLSGDIRIGSGALEITGNTFDQTARDIEFDTNFGTISVSQAGHEFVVSGSVFGSGSLAKVGDGTLTLTNTSNALTDLFVGQGAVNLDGGGLTLQDGLVVGGFGSDVVFRAMNGATLTTLATGLFGGIAIAGEMLVDGVGTTVTANGLTGVMSVFGPASLTISGGATFNSRAGAEVVGGGGPDTASVIVTGAGSTWNVDDGLGCFCGPAILTASDGGTINSPDGIFLDVGSVLNIGNGGGAGTVVTPEIENFGRIVANFTDAATLGGVISGDGTLTKVGRGILTLTGNSTYTGGTAVNNGTLVVNGSLLSSDIVVGANGTLGGAGRVGDVTVDGTLAAGNSIGTLRITRDLTFNAGSTYEVETSPAAADRTNVFGKAALAGTVVVTYLPGTFITRSYTILHAEGGLGGTRFDALSAATLPGLETSLRYVGKDVLLITEVDEPEEPTDPDLKGVTLNERRALKTILDYFKDTGSLPAEFAALDEDTLNFVTGELSTGAITAGILAADKFLDMISDPSNGANAASGGEPIAFADQPDATASSSEIFAKSLANSSKHSADAIESAFASRWKVWGGAYGGASEIEGEPVVIGSADVDARVFGIAGGIEHVFGNGAIGLALGGGSSSFELAGGLGSGNAGTFNAGVYVNQSFDNLYMVGALAYGFHAVDTSRTVFGNALTADFNAHTFSGRAEIGYRLDIPIATIAPYAAFQAINYQMPAYSESGPGVFPLDYAASSTTATRIELGARIEHPIALSNGAVMKLTGRAAWAINGGTERRAVASFPSLAGQPFIVDGAAPARHAALIDAGAEFDFGNNLAAAVTFQSEFSSNVTSYGAKAKFSYRW